jgi:hypothetical protein
MIGSWVFKKDWSQGLVLFVFEKMTRWPKFGKASVFCSGYYFLSPLPYYVVKEMYRCLRCFAVVFSTVSRLTTALGTATRGITPVAPLLGAPLPVAPLLVAPLPVAPLPVAPLPVAPLPVAPLPVAPLPVAPLPVASLPVAPLPMPPLPVGTP